MSILQDSLPTGDKTPNTPHYVRTSPNFLSKGAKNFMPSLAVATHVVHEIWFTLPQLLLKLSCEQHNIEDFCIESRRKYA